MYINDSILIDCLTWFRVSLMALRLQNLHRKITTFCSSSFVHILDHGILHFFFPAVGNVRWRQFVNLIYDYVLNNSSPTDGLQVFCGYKDPRFSLLFERINFINGVFNSLLLKLETRRSIENHRRAKMHFNFYMKLKSKTTF